MRSLTHNQPARSPGADFFMSCCRYAVGGEAVAVQHLLDEALAAAVDRAVDPALLQVRVRVRVEGIKNQLL